MIIRLRALSAQTLLGVYDFEREALRQVVLNLDITVDAERAIASDDVKDTLDYAALEEKIVVSLAQQRFALLEALAHHVARLVLEHRLVREVTVEILKPGALKHAESVAVVYRLAR